MSPRRGRNSPRSVPRGPRHHPTHWTMAVGRNAPLLTRPSLPAHERLRATDAYIGTVYTHPESTGAPTITLGPPPFPYIFSLLHPPTYVPIPLFLGIWRIMAHLPNGQVSHPGAQRCGLLVKPPFFAITPQCDPQSHLQHQCLRERYQVETNSGGYATIVGQNTGDLKMPILRQR